MTGRKKKVVCDENPYISLACMSIHDSLVSQGKCCRHKSRKNIERVLTSGVLVCFFFSWGAFTVVFPAIYSPLYSNIQSPGIDSRARQSGPKNTLVSKWEKPEGPVWTALSVGVCLSSGRRWTVLIVSNFSTLKNISCAPVHIAPGNKIFSMQTQWKQWIAMFFEHF